MIRPAAEPRRAEATKENATRRFRAGVRIALVTALLTATDAAADEINDTVIPLGD